MFKIKNIHCFSYRIYDPVFPDAGRTVFEKFDAIISEHNNYTIVGYYADEGISARKPMKHRHGLLRLLEDVKRDKIDMILVTKLDRWFRNIKDYNITEEILQAHNCHWKTIFENYDSSTANGQMVINIMLSVNQADISSVILILWISGYKNNSRRNLFLLYSRKPETRIAKSS